MITEIKNKYLIFPVNSLGTVKKMIFRADGEVVYQLDIKLDNIAPDFYAYIDVSGFLGKTLDVSVEPEMQIVFRKSDEMNIENLYNEPMRPQVHFTTKNGWLNDPNGLIYSDGVYHMFYQHNPAEPNWGNMHWGHAESRDLIHWEQKDIALFPDERGAMFSGCALSDNKNILGKNKGNEKAMLLFYTTTAPFCQYMSYSVDNFKTIKRYGDRPVVPHIEANNRDPKVIFCEELDCYIMALFLDEDRYCLLKSDNLIDWTEFQSVRLEGDLECPDIFPLCDGEGNRKWVFMGANDKYLVGFFKDGKFEAEQPVQSLRYGSSGYAGQSFSNLPDGRVVRVIWEPWTLPILNFKGQMGIPTEMTLSKYDGKYYLEANPVRELECIYKNRRKYCDVTVTPGKAFKEVLDDTPQLFKIAGHLAANGALNIKVFGRTIHFDFAKNEIRIGESVAPISVSRADFDITVIVDRCSIELFSDGGKIFMSCIDENTLSDRNIPYFTINSENEIKLEGIEINSLDSIWG